MRVLRREHTKHFQMSYISDDKDYSIPLEQRAKEISIKKDDDNEKEEK